MKRHSKILAMIYFCCLQLPLCNSQNYVPLPDSNAIWSEYYFIWESINPIIYPYYMILEGDTLINNFTYHKIIKSNDTIINFSEDHYTGCFREDNNKAVYFLPADSVNEVLLYDFSKEVGDTIIIPAHPLWKYNPILFIIDKIDSIEIEGNFRKMFTFEDEWLYVIYWIEGIGSTQGFLHSFYTYGIDEGAELNCLTYNGDFIYQNPVSLSTDCFVSTYIEDKGFNDRITISPNPSNGIFSLNGDFDHLKSIMIFSALGDLITEKPLNWDYNIVDLSDLNPGMYILKIKDNISGEFFIQKIILKK